VLAVALLVMLQGCVVPVVAPYGQQDPTQDPVASSYLAVDFHTKKVLVARNPLKRLPVAGLSKVATAVVALDWSEAAGVAMTTKVVVPNSAHPAILGQTGALGLMPGDRLSLRDALYAILMVDDGASSMAVAHLVGADLLARTGQVGDPIDHFVLQMNALAARVGMSNTRFVDPYGADNQRGRSTYSTAADMAKLAMEAANRSSMLFYSGQEQRVISVQNTAGERKLRLTNTNALIGKHGIDGLRAGNSAKAGPCLLLTALRPARIEKLPDGRTQITPQRKVVVVLNAADRFGLGERILQEGWRRYDAWYAAGMTYTSEQEFLQNL
jgi:D-alanyl-D-alanine carboxypeptidase (penicillin-binding protein 5/6)